MRPYRFVMSTLMRGRHFFTMFSVDSLDALQEQRFGIPLDYRATRDEHIPDRYGAAAVQSEPSATRTQRVVWSGATRCSGGTSEVHRSSA